MRTLRDFPRISSAPPISERAPRLLVVSPYDDRRTLLSLLLEGDGSEVLAVADGDEVLRLTAEFEPDLVLLDTEQQHSSGIEVCAELKASDPKTHLPVIMVSFDVPHEMAVAGGLMAGADDFIADVSRQIELAARVRSQLRNRRLFDALQRVRTERDLLRRDAEIDPLTGLMNRRALERAAVDRVEGRERFGVLFIDADHFKAINDTFGHHVGDRVLVALADVLRSGLRPGDAIGRFGGEEFVALVAGAGPEAARLVAERLRRCVEQIEVRGGPDKVTVSVGTAVFDPRESGDTAAQVMQRADTALYSAKHAGRNRVVMYSAESEPPVCAVTTEKSDEAPPASRVSSARPSCAEVAQ